MQIDICQQQYSARQELHTQQLSETRSSWNRLQKYSERHMSRPDPYLLSQGLWHGAWASLCLQSFSGDSEAPSRLSVIYIVLCWFLPDRPFPFINAYCSFHSYWTTFYWALNYYLQRVLAPSKHSSQVPLRLCNEPMNLKHVSNLEGKSGHYFEINYMNCIRLYYTLKIGIKLNFFIYPLSYCQYFLKNNLSWVSQWRLTEWFPHSRHARCCDSMAGVYLDSQKKSHRSYGNAKDLVSEMKAVVRMSNFDSNAYPVKAWWWGTPLLPVLIQGPSRELSPHESVCLRPCTAMWAVDTGVSFFLQPGNQFRLNLVFQIRLRCLQHTPITHHEPVPSGLGTQSTSHSGSCHTSPSTTISNVGQ